MLSVLVQDVHQVGDVAGGQSQRLDLRQLGVGRHVGDTLSELCKRRVNTLGSAPFLSVSGGSPLHGAGVCVVVDTDSSSVHRDGAGSWNQATVSVVVVMVMVVV